MQLDKDGNGTIDLQEFLNWSQYTWEHVAHRSSITNSFTGSKIGFSIKRLHIINGEISAIQ